MSSPAGVFHPPTVPLLEGIYSGRVTTYNNSGLVTIPAVGGSSGSAVLNSNMNLVGLIYAAAVGFEHSSIMINLQEIRSFLKEGLAKDPDNSDDHLIVDPFLNKFGF